MLDVPDGYFVSVTHDAPNRYHDKREHQHHVLAVFATAFSRIPVLTNFNFDYVRITEEFRVLVKWQLITDSAKFEKAIVKSFYCKDTRDALKVMEGQVAKGMKPRVRVRAKIREQPRPEFTNGSSFNYSEEWWDSNLQGATIEVGTKNPAIPGVTDSIMIYAGALDLVLKPGVEIDTFSSSGVSGAVTVAADTDFMFHCHCGRKTEWLPAAAVFDTLDRLKEINEHTVDMETLEKAAIALS